MLKLHVNILWESTRRCSIQALLVIFWTAGETEASKRQNFVWQLSSWVICLNHWYFKLLQSCNGKVNTKTHIIKRNGNSNHAHCMFWDWFLLTLFDTTRSLALHIWLEASGVVYFWAGNVFQLELGQFLCCILLAAEAQTAQARKQQLIEASTRHQVKR